MDHFEHIKKAFEINFNKNPEFAILIVAPPAPVHKNTDNQKSRILAEHGGLESNVPINHPVYWGLKSGE